MERGLFLEVPLEKEGAESGGVQKWKSAFTLDLMQMSGVNKPGQYTVDMFASAPTTGGDTFYYSNFGANFRFDLTLMDDAGGTCAKGPWASVILASALDGQARFLEGYACSAQPNDVVDVELLEGFAEPFRVVATLKANKQKVCRGFCFVFVFCFIIIYSFSSVKRQHWARQASSIHLSMRCAATHPTYLCTHGT